VHVLAPALNLAMLSTALASALALAIGRLDRGGPPDRGTSRHAQRGQDRGGHERVPDPPQSEHEDGLLLLSGLIVLPTPPHVVQV
jgi:hypothetical protein